MQATELLREAKQQLLKELPSTHEVFYKWFLALTEVHRPSQDLEFARKKCIEWAHKLGAEVAEDEGGNILLSIPASPGCESVPSFCIQGHLDIVAVGKFDTEGQVFLKLENGKLTSGQSSIGADDGIAVAAMYAIIEQKDKFKHGPLEFLITMDEEIGLIGASKLAGPPFLKSRALLNLDSEEWGTFITSCAGGMSAFYEVPLKREPIEGQGLKITLSDLMGGHTGIMIHVGRMNAVKWMDRLLLAARSENINFRLASIDGGEKHNAIPSSATAIVVTKEVERFQETLIKFHALYVLECKKVETKVPKLAIEPCEVKEAFCECCHNKVLNLLAAIYHGVWEMHPEIPGQVRTSQSMSITRTTPEKLTVQVYGRSNEATMMPWLRDQNECLAKLAGVEIRIPADDIMRPWPAALTANITEIASQTYETLYGKKPIITSIHAGLECGCIQERGYPDMECLSIGPDVEGAHSTEEAVSVDTANKCYDLTLEIIKNWATK